MPTAGQSDDDRLFVKDGFRHYRRTYSLAEVRWGLLVGLGLLAIGAWVAWRGAHPDPSLFQADVNLLEGAAASATDRGALPEGLGEAVAQGEASEESGKGWQETKFGQYDADNLYVRINGRADFFLSFGFERLHAMSLVGDEASIDIEMYDMGRAANALGAYMGEKSEEAEAVVDETGMHHLDRNALFFTRGPYYVRLIGSSESPAVQAKLRAVHDTFVEAVAGEPLPWAYGIFVGEMGLGPGTVSYLTENAFSFGFATDVYAADVSAGEDDSTEIFVVAKADDEEAEALSARFMEGFANYGEEAETVAEITLVKDRYIDTRAGAKAVGRFVIGVRGAVDAASAGDWLSKLEAAVANMPEDVRARAVPADGDGAEASAEGPAEGHGRAQAAGEGAAAADSEPPSVDGVDDEAAEATGAAGEDMYGNPTE